MDCDATNKHHWACRNVIFVWHKKSYLDKNWFERGQKRQIFGISERLLPPPKPKLFSKLKILGPNEKAHVTASPMVFVASQSTQWISRSFQEASALPNLNYIVMETKPPLKKSIVDQTCDSGALGLQERDGAGRGQDGSGREYSDFPLNTKELTSLVRT